MKPEEFPDKSFAEKCWTHDFERLVLLAELKTELATAMADADFDANWTTVKDWNESIRYARKTKAEAEALFQAITDSKHGVLPWIKLHW
jgi:hypothetical protein